MPVDRGRVDDRSLVPVYVALGFLTAELVFFVGVIIGKSIR